MRNLESRPAKVVNEHLFQALERKAQIEQRAGCLVDARIEDDRLELSLEVITIQYKLTV